MNKKSLRWIELVGIIVIAAALVAIVLPALSRAREASDRASCQNNLKQWGAIFKMYASENSGYYPRCATKNERTNTDSPEHGFVAAPYGPSLYPNYVSDLNIFFCPSSEEKVEDYTTCPGGRWCNLKTDQLDARNFADSCYTYLGWAASKDEHFAAIVASLFLEDQIDPENNPQTADNDLNLEDFGGASALHARFNAVVGPQLAAADLSLPALKGNGEGFVNSDGSSLHRMKEGLERFVITNVGDSASGIAQSCLMVMWDRVSDKPEDFSHVPAGCNVLFADGHVEFRKYPWHYPVTKVSAVLSRLID